MKKTTQFLGIAVLTALFAFALTSCDNGTTGGNDPALVGTWEHQITNSRISFLSGGRIGGEESMRWSTSGSTLTLIFDSGDSDSGTFVLSGDGNTLTISGFSTELEDAISIRGIYTRVQP